MKNKEDEFYPVALTIAGSDSGGGAGVQVDLRTFNALGIYGCSAITAVTAQNPEGVRRIDPIPLDGVLEQIQAVCDKFAVKYVKTGMLFNQDIVKGVSEMVKRYNLSIVVDPVMVATSGAVLLEDSAIEALKNDLLPLAKWMTPNIPEAELLLNRKLTKPLDFIEAAQECAKRWKCNCFLKSGHDLKDKDKAIDYIALVDESVYLLSSPRLPDIGSSHGTGCTLSAALTADFAMNVPWKQAVTNAKSFVLGSLADSVKLGPSINGMYPPEDDYSGYVKLEPWGKQGKK